MRIERSELTALVERLNAVEEELDKVAPYLDEQSMLRDQIRTYLIENDLTNQKLCGRVLSIGTRKRTNVTDEEQLRRTLKYRGVLDDCLVLDMGRVRKVLGDEALGIETTEQQYLIVRHNDNV